MQAKDASGKSSLAKSAGILSLILWVLGFGLAFVIPPLSYFYWVPDALLLIGFWPLLLVWRSGWPWIAFGILNIVIGFVLEMMMFLPDTNFTIEMKLVRKHLAEYHCALVWILIGAASFIYGLFRFTKSSISYFRSKICK
jgi:hypothetical protein